MSELPSPPPRWAGRFAPTPSGPLHVGSLIAAVASRADALARGGRWMLRIDDIDPPREAPGARAAIPRTLERFGLTWDGPIRYQSGRLERYADALHALAAAGHLYRCRCTRRMLEGRTRCPGTCGAARADALDREAVRPLAVPRHEPADALRLRLEGPLRVEDAVQGPLGLELAACPGDVVVRRRDGLVAYPLACAVDDADVSHVVRGADLLEASAAQQAVLERLGVRPPRWAHVPLAVDGAGRKLGKSAGAAPVDRLDPLPTLLGIWRFLGQAPLAVDSLEDFWALVPGRWSLAAVPAVRERPTPSDPSDPSDTAPRRPDGEA